ncbi:MAG: hypothetical protein JKY65_24645 [Planctomycetes bacterium]|nr:hypothetical protein [Planctomycetota bacterium]
MSLKLRKIKGYLEIHGKQCTEELNKKLGTQLSYEFDWGCIPDNIPEWNWSEPDLKRCFYNSYFLPIEQCLEQLFGDPLYKEAINEQVKVVRVVPRDGTFLEAKFADGVLSLSQSLSVTQGQDGGGPYLERSVKIISHTIESQLS